jgi:hypothetical protein
MLKDIIKTKEQIIQDLLDNGGSSDEIKLKLKELFSNNGDSCALSYSENYKPDDSCENGMSVQGVITVTNCSNPGDNTTYVGAWHCK